MKMTLDNKSHYTVVGINTLEQYAALPRSERERRVNYWLTPWYKRPYALIWTLPPRGSNAPTEWEKVDDFLKQNYPIQFWVRENAEEVSYYLRYRVWSRFLVFWQNWIIGQRTEMRKAVFPRDYQDIDGMVVEFHRQCLIEFVERENAFDWVDYTQSEEDKKFATELREQYDYATRGRAILLKEVEDELAKVDLEWTDTATVQSKYDEYYKIEKKQTARDTEMCNWVVNNRYRLWT